MKIDCLFAYNVSFFFQEYFKEVFKNYGISSEFWANLKSTFRNQDLCKQKLKYINFNFINMCALGNEMITILTL